MPKKKAVIFQYQLPWWRRSLSKIILLTVFLGFVLLMPGQNIYTQLLSGKPTFFREFDLPRPTPAPYPINRTGVYPGSEVTGQGVVVLDVDSGVTLYQRNESDHLSPASTTKVLTALVALKNFSLDDVVTVGTVANDGQVMGLVPGERITVENLLYGALIQSGNDAAYTLAAHYPGGVAAFVTAMNDTAAELHLTSSTFTNPVGYDDPNHKMTPRDLAKLGAAALSNKVIAKMVAIPQITVSDVTFSYFHPLKNVNQLLGKIPGVGGIKTGWTEEAGENLLTLVERNGHKIIIVVLKSQDRFGDTTKLIDWVFANHHWEVFNPTAQSIQDQ